MHYAGGLKFPRQFNMSELRSLKNPVMVEKFIYDTFNDVCLQSILIFLIEYIFITNKQVLFFYASFHNLLMSSFLQICNSWKVMKRKIIF